MAHKQSLASAVVDRDVAGMNEGSAEVGATEGKEEDAREWAMVGGGRGAPGEVSRGRRGDGEAETLGDQAVEETGSSVAVAVALPAIAHHRVPVHARRQGVQKE